MHTKINLCISSCSFLINIIPSIFLPQIHGVIDMNDFEHTFSAYQRSEGSPQDSLKQRPKIQPIIGERPKELSVVDGRRAQNLNILLSRYKLSEEDIRTIVLSMDREKKMDKDMVEQLLKYVPTSAEKELLESHIHEKSSFARADRFMFITSGYVVYLCVAMTSSVVVVVVVCLFVCFIFYFIIIIGCCFFVGYLIMLKD